VCIDFRDLNKVTLMDVYAMLVADTLLNAAAGHNISFMDGNAGYNQIFMAIEDIAKSSFKCPGHVGLYEWIIMTFGLKNTGATYQRAMNYMLTVQNRAQVHRRPMGDLVPFSPRRVLPRFVNPRIGSSGEANCKFMVVHGQEKYIL
jgi:hypothetical protein